MKHLLTLLALLLLTTFVNSQEIVDSTKMWSCMEEHCQPWGSTYSTDYFRFDKDTIINDTVYKKVWISEDENYEQWSFYGAMIREVDNRIYFRQLFGEEGLIYDFNMEIGDSVLIDNPRAVGEIFITLEEIDSVETEVGFSERWKLTSSEYPDAEYWIKGIGSETGVLNSSSGIFGGLCGLYTLLCEKENDELVYLNPDYNACFLYTTGHEELDDSGVDFRFQYNRNEKVLSLTMTENTNNTILLTDISGRIIRNYQSNSSIENISLLSAPPGVYIVSVLLSGKVSSQKFVIY